MLRCNSYVAVIGGKLHPYVSTFLSHLTLQVDPILTPMPSANRNSSWVEIVIPQVFSHSTTQYMEKKVITKGVRAEIGETLSHRVYAVTK